MLGQGYDDDDDEEEVGKLLCGRRMPLQLYGIFQKMTIRVALLYGAICRATKRKQENEMHVAEMLC